LEKVNWMPLPIALAFLVLMCAVLAWIATARNWPGEPGLAGAVLAALGMQFGVVFGLTGRSVGAAIILGLVLGQLSWWWSQASGVSPAHVWSTHFAAAALVLAVIGMVRYMEAARNSGFGDSGNSTEAKSGTNSSGKQVGTNPQGVTVESSTGVILWPEQEEHTTLVPPLPLLKFGLPAVAPASLSIPFFGVWFYRAPDRRPPEGSLQTRGDTARIRFSSTDGAPIKMEARQNLGTSIRMDCCRGLDVIIRNGDRFPGTIWLELLLGNTLQKGRPAITLGIKRVDSTLSWLPADARPPVEETIRFEFPASSSLREFDELTVRFLLAGPRVDRSAKIAIRRFVLVR